MWGGSHSDHRSGGGWWYGDSCAEAPVLLLELSDSALEIRKLCFPPVPAVLGGDTVAVGASFFALF